MNNSDIFAEQKRLYTESYKRFAGGPEATMQVHSDYQYLRFQKILDQIINIDNGQKITMLDYACGPGDLLEYLQKKDIPISYSGIDINENYINFAKNKFKDMADIFILQKSQFPSLTSTYDYICISGMFHYKGTANPKEWEAVCKKLIKDLFKHVNKGLIFNCLTSQVDFMDANLFYWDPNIVIDFVGSSFSRYFKIDHAYPLYEWTLAIYTEEFMQSQFKQPTFHKYF